MNWTPYWESSFGWVIVHPEFGRRGNPECSKPFPDRVTAEAECVRRERLKDTAARMMAEYQL